MEQLLQNFLEFDERLSGRLRITNGSKIRKLAAFFAHSGDSWFWMAGLVLIWLISFIFYDKSWCYRCLLLAACIGFQALFVLAIKFLIRRQRPESDWGEIYRRGDPHSFPSGHATRAVMLAVIVAIFGPTWLAWVLVIWAPLVCLARIALGVHYISDITAGALLGILLGWLLPKLVAPVLVWLSFLY